MKAPRALAAAPAGAILLAFLAAAAFALCAAPRLGAPGLECHEAQEAAEAVVFLSRHGELKRLPILDNFFWAFDKLPWMHMYHMGAVKTYAMAAAFALFGIGPLVLRGVTVAFGATAVFFSILLAARLYGTAWAAGLGLWLATDPALVILARHDWAPAAAAVGLKMAGLWFLFSGAEDRSRWRLFLGGLLFGLCLWEKIHFVWFLGGTAAALAACVPAERWRSRETAIPALAGLLLGASPLILFNLVHPLLTFTAQQSANAAYAVQEGALIAGLPKRVFTILDSSLAVFTGAGLVEMIAGPSPERVTLAGLRFAPLLAAAAGLFVLRRRRGHSISKGAAFWAVSTLGAVGAACLTPAPVRSYHVPMLYPLAHFAVLAVIAEGVAVLDAQSRAVRTALGLFLAAAVAGNVAVLGSFYGRLARTGGYGPWYSGVMEVARLCGEGEANVIAPYEFTAPLIIYLNGRTLPRAGAKPRQAGLTRIATYDWVEPGHPLTSSFPASGLERARVLKKEEIPHWDQKAWATVYTAEVAGPAAAPEPKTQQPSAGQTPPAPPARRQSDLLRQAGSAARAGSEDLSRRLLTEAQGLGLSAEEDRRAAAIYRLLKDDARALDILDRLTRASPDEAGLWLEQAEAAVSNGKNAPALASLQRCENLAPDAGQLRRAAEAYGALGEHRRAEAILKKLVRRFPKDAALSHRLALTYQALKEHRKAVDLLERLSREHPADASYLSDMGINEFLAGSADAAVRDLKEAIRLEPRALSAYLSLAAVYAAQDRAADALSVYDQALAVKTGKDQDGLRKEIAKERDALPARARKN